MKVDYYDFLGISRTSNENDIKRAYYKKALECHPDKNPGDEEAKAKFQLLNKIYVVLSDQLRRSDYDRFGEESEGEDDMGNESVECEENEEENNQWPSYEEMAAVFNAMKVELNEDGFQNLTSSLDHELTMASESVYTEAIVQNELRRALEKCVFMLNFSNRSIISLPSSLGELVLLCELNISGNLLTHLPKEIGLLKQLKRLEAGKNQLECLPDEIGNLQSLEVLNLEHNKLKTLPPSIAHLEKLNRLILFDNLLSNLPDTFKNLVGTLRLLDLECNPLITLPDVLNSPPITLELRVFKSQPSSAHSKNLSEDWKQLLGSISGRSKRASKRTQHLLENSERTPKRTPSRTPKKSSTRSKRRK